MITTTKFILSNENIFVTKYDDSTALDVLPPKVYNVKYNDAVGYFLENSVSLFSVPEKLYGNVNARTAKCIRTYKSRTTSTGILMTGVKGTGKSLLLATLANAAILELKIPVLVIKEPYFGERFISFLETIGECCLVFDEFGKMYTKRNKSDDLEATQDSLLSLFDGVNKSKRMILMTENDSIDISEFILGRPSRAYYHFKYPKIDEVSITEYCEDYNIEESAIDEILDICRHAVTFNFDMLQSVVEEHIRFQLPISECVKDLNIDVNTSKPLLSIERVIHKITNTTCDVKTPIVNKPVGRHDTTCIMVESSTINNDGEIWLNESDIKFTTNGFMVYDTSDFIVTAKEMPPSFANYSALF